MSNDGLRMKYFVLKPDGNDEYAEASRRAIAIYAGSIQLVNPELADDLLEWHDRARQKASDE